MKSDIFINKLFTVNSLKKMIFKNDMRTFRKTFSSLYSKDNDNLSMSEAFSLIYSYMAKNHRNEYFYKNALLNKILLGRHSVNTSTALRELPISDNILDFVIINGIGQVYEIKTELDNLKRLRGQIDSYYNAFSYCNVVTDEGHLQAVMQEVDSLKVGIIVLTKRNTLHVVREPQEFNDKLNYVTMFKLLRKYEFEAILLNKFGELPDAKPVKYYEACLEMFRKLSIKEAQEAMLQQLKKRVTIDRDNEELFQQVPLELKALIYFSNFRTQDFRLLTNFLDRKLGDVF